MISRWLVARSLAALACACGLSAVQAGPVGSEFGPNLVVNGGFENTTSMAGSGWTASGFLAEGFDYAIDSSSANAHSGSNSFMGGGIGTPGSILQTLATVAGAHYNIHLWLANLSGFTSKTELDVYWNGALVYSASDIAGSGYSEIVIDPMASDVFATLTLSLRDDDFFLNVDDVAVYRVRDSGRLPEPASLGLVGLAVSAWAFGARRRSNAGLAKLSAGRRSRNRSRQGPAP